uniref:Uncharacterized protein n=1 Tax=Brassica campestris TaxID=3711 RepID=M4FHB0_BRACM
MELDEDRVHKMGNDEGSGDGFQNLSDGEVEVNSDQVTEGLNLADGDVVNGLPEEKASVVGDVEKKKVVRKGLFKSTAVAGGSTVGTEIRTVDFRLNKETKKTLVSQRTRISVNYHTSSNQNTRITTIKIRNRKESKVDLIPNLRMSVTTSGKHGLSLLRSSGDSIRRFDENAWTGVVSMFGKVQSLHSDRTLARARSLRSDRVRRVLGRYVATERDDRSVATDRAGRLLGRYVATELWLELGCYVATERDDRLARMVQALMATRKRTASKPTTRQGEGAKQQEEKGPSNPNPTSSKP